MLVIGQWRHHVHPVPNLIILVDTACFPFRTELLLKGAVEHEHGHNSNLSFATTSWHETQPASEASACSLVAPLAGEYLDGRASHEDRGVGAGPFELEIAAGEM